MSTPSEASILSGEGMPLPGSAFCFSHSFIQAPFCTPTVGWLCRKRGRPCSHVVVVMAVAQVKKQINRAEGKEGGCVGGHSCSVVLDTETALGRHLCDIKCAIWTVCRCSVQWDANTFMIM